MTHTRPPDPVTRPRSWPVPAGGTVLHVVGDVHAGAVPALDGTRRGKVTTDVASGRMLPNPVAEIFTGDLVNDATPVQDDLISAWVDTMPDLPRYYACGNHDIWGNARTPADFAAAYGMPGVNYTVDAGDVRLIFVGPDNLTGGDNTTINLSATTQTWLDGQLDATSRDCLIVCHAPLAETALGNVSQVYTTRRTDDGGVFAVNQGVDSNLRTILADHPNAKAWIAGHTHTPSSEPTVVVGQTIGSHTMAMVNASAVAFVGRAYSLDSPIACAYVNYLGDRIEVRYRDHGGRSWGTVTSVSL